jgi:hypothetical protein
MKAEALRGRARKKEKKFLFPRGYNPARWAAGRQAEDAWLGNAQDFSRADDLMDTTKGGIGG